jgi:predicted secreted protein
MGIGTSIAVFMTIWWTALFAILPLGVKTYAEMGEQCPGGGDPAAPVNPNLKRKFFTTTWVSVLIFAVVWSVIRFHLIDLPSLPSGY